MSLSLNSSSPLECFASSDAGNSLLSSGPTTLSLNETVSFLELSLLVVLAPDSELDREDASCELELEFSQLIEASESIGSSLCSWIR